MTRVLDVGDAVPSFSLPDQDGVSFTLAQALGKGPLVVFFYPKDETTVCIKEACAFRDAHQLFVAAGATVLGVSGDSVASHKAFAEHHALGFRLLADVGDKVRNDVFGVPRDLLGFVAGRGTYVLDETGVVRMRYQAPLGTSTHVEKALAVIRKLAAKT